MTMFHLKPTDAIDAESVCVGGSDGAWVEEDGDTAALTVLNQGGYDLVEVDLVKLVAFIRSTGRLRWLLEVK